MTRYRNTGKKQYKDHLKNEWTQQPWAHRPKQFSNKFIHRWNYAEEILNSLTHGIGALLGAVALILLIMRAHPNSTLSIVSGFVFGSSLIAAFGISTIYHAALYPPTKKILQILDHCSIFILIAGTYTPFCLVTLNGIWGWSIFSIIWGCALLGIGMKCWVGERFEPFFVTLYLIMGWFAVLASYQLILHLPTPGLILLLMGGLFYTFGVIFFIFEQVPFFHTIWHLFVLAGAMSHFFAIYIDVMPVNIAMAIN